MKKIVKVIFEDGESLSYQEKSLEDFNNNKWSHANQHRFFEEKILDNHILLDLEDYAKESFNLISEDEQKDLSDYDNDEIEFEMERRNLGRSVFKNENINNESFIDRFVNIVDRGNDFEIDNILEMLEKNYKIK